MKKTLALILAMAVLIMSFPVMSVVAAGTDAEGYTLIETAADFELIRENPSGSYKLMNDITLPDTYIPIAFSGKLIGADEENLKSIKVNIGAEDSVNYWGLFSVVSGAFQIKNITLKGSVTGANGDGQASWGYLGGFAGMTSSLKEGAIIENCVNEATITNEGTTPEGTGGFIGMDRNTTHYLTLKRLTNKGVVTTTSINNGGIAGTFSGTALYCSNFAAITGSHSTQKGGSGGLVGNAEGAVIEQSFNTGSVIDNNASGGIVGFVNYEGNSGTNGVTIRNCYNTATHTARQLATCAILGAANKSGSDVLIENCYTSVISQTRPVAYITDSIHNPPVINSYYLRAVASSDNDGSTHFTEDQFTNLSSFTGFSSDIWEIETLSSYKYPQLKNNRQAYKEYVEIATAQDFELIRNNPAGAYKIVADINLGNFTPIDNFSGELIGDNEAELRTITIASTSPTDKGQEYYGGLFKKISGSASIQNIKLEGTLSVFSDGNYNSHIGGFAGAVVDGTKGINITNCVNDVDITIITTSKIYIYGLGGFIGTNGWYLDSGANGTACSELVLEKLINYGTLSAGEGAGIGRFYAVGGIAGSAAGIIKKCAKFAEISQVSATQVGGILGSTNGVVIEDSFNVANLINTGSKQSAGIVCAIGIPESTATITRCFHNGSTRFGIAGFDAVVTECYSIYGGGGGLDNHITSNNANVSKSYFYYPSSATVNGATYATLEQMKQETFLTDFDFENIWIIDAKSSYPYPQLRANRTAYEVINEIRNQDDFKAMNDSSESFKLMDDIELTGDYAVASFSGYLDGNGYTITITDGTTALFALLNANAVVENFNIEGSVTAPAVVAKVSAGKINNVKNYAALAANAIRAGVFVGETSYGAVITNCGNFADITISGSYNMVGGIVGDAYYATIENCVNKGNITSESFADYIGGIAGQLRGANITPITNCMNVGDITSAASGKQFGGIVGSIPNAAYVNVTISNSYNAGKVKIGGEDITNANAIYAQTLAEGTNASTCYYLVSGTSEGKAGNGKTADELKTQSTFEGWEFSNTVWIMPGADKTYKYPQLAGLTFDVNAGETKEFPYEIDSLEDFKAISIGSQKLYYKLTDDIELTGDYAISSFSGDLDGNGKNNYNHRRNNSNIC